MRRTSGLAWNGSTKTTDDAVRIRHLKRGFSLHERGLHGTQFLGRYRTCDPHPLFIAGPRFAPMMLNEPGTARVRGESYAIDEARLPVLDAMEHLGEPGNIRISIEVEPLDAGRPIPAQVYIKDRSLARPLHTGWLEDYQDRRFAAPCHDQPAPLGLRDWGASPATEIVKEFGFVLPNRSLIAKLRTADRYDYILPARGIQPC